MWQWLVQDQSSSRASQLSEILSWSQSNTWTQTLRTIGKATISGIENYLIRLSSGNSWLIYAILKSDFQHVYGRKESDTTEWLIWSDLIVAIMLFTEVSGAPCLEIVGKRASLSKSAGFKFLTLRYFQLQIYNELPMTYNLNHICLSSLGPERAVRTSNFKSQKPWILEFCVHCGFQQSLELSD